MRNIFLRLILLTTAGLIPAVVLAHGGVSQTVNNARVFLYQQPLSPLVGETVTFSFKLTDLNLQALPNLPVRLVLTETFYGDESKDKQILAQDLTTDANGVVEYSYKFEKENYFDIDLQFNDPVTNELDNTGFLVQLRAAGKAPAKPNYLLLGLLGVFCGLLLNQILARRKR